MAKVDALIRWLMPKEERFHELFDQDTANLLRAAQLFSEFVQADLPTRRAAHARAARPRARRATASPARSSTP